MGSLSGLGWMRQARLNGELGEGGIVRTIVQEIRGACQARSRKIPPKYPVGVGNEKRMLSLYNENTPMS